VLFHRNGKENRSKRPVLTTYFLLFALWQNGLDPGREGVAQGDWRSEMNAQMDGAPVNAGAREIQRFEQNVRTATPYASASTPDQYEANRALARRMAAYLATVDSVAHDPQMRFALRRAHRAVDLFAYSAFSSPPPSMERRPSEVAPPSAPPPFSVQAPEIKKLSPAERKTARDWQVRYEAAATQAMAAWRSADMLRANLNSDGMTLNARTETSLGRVAAYLEAAADALCEHDWVDTETNLRRAESETAVILKTVGH
jgi:hypothetical protein